ncbi:MAG: glycosyltransferase family 39 protein [Proteobacteria bacterium]|nr:glycosyltransferase family 39 protein [Pseudomonadota bacterium]
MPASTRIGSGASAAMPGATATQGWVRGTLLFLTAAALLLRLYGIETPSMSHPEIYVPGIDLIPGHSVPPPRLTWGDTFRMHFHDEPHPILWYLAMFGWTEMFGTSHLALRLPSAITGAATIPLMFLLGRRVFGVGVGLLAAALLSVHSLHLFWSQAARMYAAGAFLSILATWLLLRIASDPRAGRGAQAGYVAAVVAGVGSVELFWPLIGMHVAWAALMLPAGKRSGAARGGAWLFSGTHRILQLQAVALILSVPELLHAVYRARGGAASEPSLGWLSDYFSFGFLYRSDGNVWDAELPGAFASGLLLLAALILLGLALRVRGIDRPPLAAGRDLRLWRVVALALVVTAFMMWLATIAYSRNWALYVVATAPLLSLFLPKIATYLAGTITGRLHGFVRWRERANSATVLIWMLAVVAPLATFAGSGIMSLLASRAFLVLVPYLLLLLVAPVVLLPRHRLVRGAGISALVGLFLGSIPLARQMNISPVDYKTLVAEMAPLMRPEDMVFVRDKDWVDAPLFYYMRDARYVFSDYAAALKAAPEARVWLVTWPYEERPVINDERREALVSYRLVEHVTARRASAELFLPPG